VESKGLKLNREVVVLKLKAHVLNDEYLSHELNTLIIFEAGSSYIYKHCIMASLAKEGTISCELSRH